MTEEEMRQFAKDMGCEIIDLTTPEDKARATLAASPEVPLHPLLVPLYLRLKEAAKQGILDHSQCGTEQFDTRGRSLAVRQIGQEIYDTFSEESFDPEAGQHAMQAAEGRLRVELPNEVELEEEDPRDPVLLSCCWDGVGIWMW